MKRFVPLIVVLFSFSFSAAEAQLPSGWRAHDLKRAAPPVVDPGEIGSTANVPSDATVLFDGSDLTNWRDGQGGEAKWKIVDGSMESVPGSGYVFTKEGFGDCQLHVEWASPSTVKGDGQGRGNSGVFLMGKYEVQVLDSFENPTYADGSAGSIYGQYPPLVNASRPPGQWQSFDIIFRKPTFDDAGKLKLPARITVLHNGVLIQDNSEAYGPTSWIQHLNYDQSADELPLSLQDHGNPVRYRNIWIRPLDSERARPAQPYEAESEIVTLTEDAKTRLVGKYGDLTVENRDGTLCLIFSGQPLEMIPLSETRFAFRKSAGHADFLVDETGTIKSIDLKLDAGGSRKADKAKPE